jgi:hypothetical protein
MQEIKYAKGHKPKDLDGAKGGLVIKRHQNFAKDEDDDMHPLGTGLLGPENSQSYAKKGKDKLADREGDTKCVAPIKPRK